MGERKMKKRILKSNRLSGEELALEKSFDSSGWIERSSFEIEKLKKAARKSVESRRKEARVNIRMSEHDVILLKERAQVEGLPYQSLMSSIIHKYVTEQLVEKKYVDEIARQLRSNKKDKEAA